MGHTSTGRLMKRLTGGVKLPASAAKHVETFTGLHGFPLDSKPVILSDLLTWAGDVAGESQHPYVVSLSYGSKKIDFCDGATRTRLSEDVQKLGAMGVTVVIASGDDGSGGMSRQGSNSGKLSPSFPASIPTALAVGATFFESGLSDEEMATTQFGSGGGFSY